MVRGRDLFGGHFIKEWGPAFGIQTLISILTPILVFI